MWRMVPALVPETSVDERRNRAAELRRKLRREIAAELDRTREGAA